MHQRSACAYQVYYSVLKVREALADPVLHFLIHGVQLALGVCLLLLQNVLQLGFIYHWAYC